LELFTELEKEQDASAELYQKMGYAYQQTSQLKEALDAYKKADLIQPDDFWTNKKIAICYRLLGDTENALAAYRHADFIKPNNISVQLQIIFCLAELKRFDEALKALTDLNNENPDNPKILRATMTVAFSGKNLAQADYFASILLEKEQATAYDFMLGGHISWCLGKNKTAKERYKIALNLLKNDWGQFVTMFKKDQSLILANGVNDDEIPLILDAISYCQLSEPNSD
jgi:tetratricopeptide (TPR) repeat protein